MQDKLASLSQKEINAITAQGSKLFVVDRLPILEQQAVIDLFKTVTGEPQGIPTHSVLKSCSPDALRAQIDNLIGVPDCLSEWFVSFANSISDKELAMIYHGVIQQNAEDLGKLNMVGTNHLMQCREYWIQIDYMLFAYCYTFVIDARIGSFSNRILSPQAKRGNSRLSLILAQKLKAYISEVSRIDSGALVVLNMRAATVAKPKKGVYNVYCIFKDVFDRGFNDARSEDAVSQALGTRTDLLAG